MEKTQLKSQWGIILLALTSGIIAAMQVGKVPPALTMIVLEFDLSRTVAGLVASIFFGIGAFLSIIIGVFSDRWGEYRLLLLGIFVLALGSLIGGISAQSNVLLIARAIEGFGFTAVVVSAPTIILNDAERRQKNLAISIWATFMPIGMAFMMAISPFLLNTIGWQGIWFINSAVLIVFLGILFLFLDRSCWMISNQIKRAAFDWRGTQDFLVRPAHWLFGVCFSLYTLQFFAVTVWLPTFLIETQNYSLTNASLFVALVILANIVGNTGAALLISWGLPRWTLMLFSFLVMGLLGALIFVSFIPSDLKIAMAILFSALTGLLPTACLAGAPAHAPSPSQIAMASGFAMQGATLGSLLGPPILGAVTSYFGSWENCWWIMLICPGIGIILVMKLKSIDKTS